MNRLKINFTIQGVSYHYTMYDSYLYCEGHKNSIVFDKLGLNAHDFCKKHYGYVPGGGEWPTCKSGDVEALHRVIKALNDIIYGLYGNTYQIY